MRAQFITAEEVQQVLGVSRSKSYQIIRDLNKELKSMGYHTIAANAPSSSSSRSSTVWKLEVKALDQRKRKNDRPDSICWRRWGTVAFLCNK